MPILILFIVVPLLEIYLLLKVGSLIGVIPTILVVIGTALLGTTLLRQQGLATLQRYQEQASQGRVPAQELVEGLALVFGGALLLTPGFFTDAIGFLCLIPATRRGVIKWLLRRVKFAAFSGGQQSSSGSPGYGADGRGRTFEADYTVEKDYRVKSPDEE